MLLVLMGRAELVVVVWMVDMIFLKDEWLNYRGWVVEYYPPFRSFATEGLLFLLTSEGWGNEM